ncbi:MAG: DVU_1553 family AMP-dependent CoA ligase [Anaerolineaceae bacterium]
MRITPLHPWIMQKIGCRPAEFDRSTLVEVQFQRLAAIIAYARQYSPFYRDLYAKLPVDIHPRDDFSDLPFTTDEDVRLNPARFVCVSQEEIHRIVTLPTSGTTGQPKRIFFTEADQALTINFFAVGMSTLVEKGDRVLILLPCERPGSVGDLLATALQQTDCVPFKFGPFQNERQVLDFIVQNHINVLVGAPVQLHRLACKDEQDGILPQGFLHSVLSSTDVLSGAIRENLTQVWGCKVFDHYGMTETGLGGGVECEAYSGYHMRDADLYYEIIDPITGRNVSEGEEGEVVVTTLTRAAMPLIRYRTGDLSRQLPGICPCGSFITRLEPIKRRLSSDRQVKGGLIYQDLLDEALFRIRGVADFEAVLEKNGIRDCLTIIGGTFTETSFDELAIKVQEALQQFPPLRKTVMGLDVKIEIRSLNQEIGKYPFVFKKRQVKDQR